MDRSFDRLSRFAAPTVALAMLVGCGGGEAKTLAPDETSPPPVGMGFDDEVPSKPLTEGLMLPDDVAIPNDAPPSSSKTDGGSSKGMQLPDGL